jgi:hypothetical protein
MDSYIIKLSGKAELPQPLELSHNFRVLLEGSIDGKGEDDNGDGTRTHYYRFKPVKVEAITELGERIVAQDTRSRSVQLRALLFKRWREENSPERFEDYYDRRMVQLMTSL